MPRYFFDVKSNEEVVLDHHGVDLPDLATAHREAIRTLVEIAEELIPLNGARTLSIFVADAGHKRVLDTHIKFDPGPFPE